MSMTSAFDEHENMCSYRIVEHASGYIATGNWSLVAALKGWKYLYSKLRRISWKSEQQSCFLFSSIHYLAVSSSHLQGNMGFEIIPV